MSILHAERLKSHALRSSGARPGYRLPSLPASAELYRSLLFYFEKFQYIGIFDEILRTLWRFPRKNLLQRSLLVLAGNKVLIEDGVDLPLQLTTASVGFGTLVRIEALTVRFSPSRADDNVSKSIWDALRSSLGIPEWFCGSQNRYLQLTGLLSIHHPFYSIY